MGINACANRPAGDCARLILRMICRAPLSRGIAHYASRLIPRGLKGPPAGGIAGIYAQKEPKRAGLSRFIRPPIEIGRCYR